jgi:hypothetical protein
LLFSIPVQNMKLAMAGVLLALQRGERRGVAPGFILPADGVPELSRRACRSARHQHQEVSMQERLYQNETEHDAPVAGSVLRPDRRTRIVGEPMISGKEWVAYALILVMVCGPLAFGAFGL